MSIATETAIVPSLLLSNDERKYIEQFAREWESMTGGNGFTEGSILANWKLRRRMSKLRLAYERVCLHGVGASNPNCVHRKFLDELFHPASSQKNLRALRKEVIALSEQEH